MPPCFFSTSSWNPDHWRRTGDEAEQVSEERIIEILRKHGNSATAAAFADAGSKQFVEYNGCKFQHRFWPLEKSRSRQAVTEWGQGWTEVEDSGSHGTEAR